MCIYVYVNFSTSQTQPEGFASVTVSAGAISPLRGALPRAGEAGLSTSTYSGRVEGP